MLTMVKRGIAAVVLAAFMPLPTNVAAQSDTAVITQNSENSEGSGGAQASRVRSLSALEFESIIRGSKFSDAIAGPLAQLEVDHHRALGTPLVRCQINLAAKAINNKAKLGSTTLSTGPSSDNTIDYASCKRRDRRNINRQRERNKSLYDALASIGGYYNNGTDQEKMVLTLGGDTLINGPAGELVTQAIGAFANEIESDAVQANTGKLSSAVIAAALGLFDGRDFWVVSQEIEAEDNTHQSHNAATGIKIILALRARTRE